MARKPATRVEFTLFDVVYEDGSQRSNRRVPSEVLGGLDGDAPARAIIEEQDRLISVGLMMGHYFMVEYDLPRAETKGGNVA